MKTYEVTVEFIGVRRYIVHADTEGKAYDAAQKESEKDIGIGDIPELDVDPCYVREIDSKASRI